VTFGPARARARAGLRAALQTAADVEPTWNRSEAEPAAAAHPRAAPPFTLLNAA